MKKLGLRPGMRASLVQTPGLAREQGPEHYFSLVEGWSPEQFLGLRSRKLDFLHLFVTQRTNLEKGLPTQLGRLAPEGMLWVSWPKKASGVTSDVTEDVVRECALPLGLVDVKVCAVDEIWSGLKLVVRKELRGSWPGGPVSDRRVGS